MPRLEPYAREAGTGSGVVCLYSNVSTSAQWRGLMDSLSPKFRVLAPTHTVPARAQGNTEGIFCPSDCRLASSEIKCAHSRAAYSSTIHRRRETLAGTQRPRPQSSWLRRGFSCSNSYAIPTVSPYRWPTRCNRSGACANLGVQRLWPAPARQISSPDG